MDDIRNVVNFVVDFIVSVYRLFTTRHLVFMLLVSLPVIGFLINKVILIMLPKRR